MHIARVAETVRGAPQEFFTAFIHEAFYNGDDFIEAGVCFGQGAAFGGNIAVMEAKIIDGELVKQLKAGVRLVFIDFHIGFAAERFVRCFDAEHIPPAGAKRVPIRNGELQRVFHGFAVYDFIGIVKAKCQRIL